MQTLFIRALLFLRKIKNNCLCFILIFPFIDSFIHLIWSQYNQPPTQLIFKIGFYTIHMENLSFGYKIYLKKQDIKIKLYFKIKIL